MDGIESSSEKQSCQPDLVTLPSDVHVKVSPALRALGIALEYSTSTPRIIKWSQQVSSWKVSPGVTLASRSIVTEQ